MSTWGAVMGHANMVMHGAGWMEGGLVASFEKFIIDVEILQMMSETLLPLKIDEAELAVDAIGEVGPGGHFFGSPHTLERYETAFYRPLVSDWRNFESWQEAGSPGAADHANRLWKQALDRIRCPSARGQIGPPNWRTSWAAASPRAASVRPDRSKIPGRERRRIGNVSPCPSSTPASGPSSRIVPSPMSTRRDNGACRSTTRAMFAMPSPASIRSASKSEEAKERARTRLLNAAKKYKIVPVGFITGQLQSEREIGRSQRNVVLPTGFVTLMMTDIEGSTALVHQLGDEYGKLHSRGADGSSGRSSPSTKVMWSMCGRMSRSPFSNDRMRPSRRCRIQLDLGQRPATRKHDVRLRIGLHSGRPTVSDGNYIGIAVHTTARICSAAHGGQIVVSGQTTDGIKDQTPDGHAVSQSRKPPTARAARRTGPVSDRGRRPRREVSASDHRRLNPIFRFWRVTLLPWCRSSAPKRGLQ